MFSRLLDKVSSFADHHQLIIGMFVGFSLICFTWGLEKILETYLWPHKPVVGYAVACFGGLFLLWLIQHFILHVV